MKLFKLSQTENRGWDTYDSLIVAAESEAEAREIHPLTEFYPRDGIDWQDSFDGWCSSPEVVTVEYIGEAKEGTAKGIILTSFNAG